MRFVSTVRRSTARKPDPIPAGRDFVWCMTALTWGWSTDETADRLMEESGKARANGRAYVDLTVRNALLAVERRKQQPKPARDFVVRCGARGARELFHPTPETVTTCSLRSKGGCSPSSPCSLALCVAPGGSAPVLRTLLTSAVRVVVRKASGRRNVKKATRLRRVELRNSALRHGRRREEKRKQYC
jgi:hypothetical protein